MNKIERLLPLDAIRGLIMVLMAIDHASEFIAHQHSSGEFWGGALPEYYDALSFLTRFITHLSAPGFFFLMGVGMHLFANSRRNRGWSQGRIQHHFLIRGVVLILLQLFAENTAWGLSLSTSSARPPGIPGSTEITYFGVLYALGGNMIIASLLMRLNPGWLVGVGSTLILGTEFLIPSPGMVSAPYSPLWRLLMIPGFSDNILVYYPLLPWLGLVLFGVLFGIFLKRDQRLSFASVGKIGVTLILGFLLVRWGNSFGNLQIRQGDAWIDFLNVVKYPPSIAFLLLTMGINLMLLGVISRARKINKLLFPLVVFGRAPLFFYIAHLYLYAGIGTITGTAGTSLAKMYYYWLLGLILLYPVTLWFGTIKQRSPSDSVIHYL